MCVPDCSDSKICVYSFPFPFIFFEEAEKREKDLLSSFVCNACQQKLNLFPVSVLLRFGVQSFDSEAARFCHAVTCIHDVGVVVVSSTDVWVTY